MSNELHDDMVKMLRRMAESVPEPPPLDGAFWEEDKNGIAWLTTKNGHRVMATNARRLRELQAEMAKEASSPPEPAPVADVPASDERS